MLNGLFEREENMYNEFLNIFAEKNLNNCLFIGRQKSVILGDFKNDIMSFIPGIRKISDSSIILHLQDNTYTFYVLFLAIILSGKNVILPAFLTHELLELLAQESKSIITDKEFNSKTFNVFNLEGLKVNTKDKISPFVGQTIKFFTSGSTNTPKMFCKTFVSLLEEVKMHSILQEEIIKKKPTVVATINPCHIYGMLWRFLFPLYNQLVQDLDILHYPEEIQIKQEKYNNLFLVSTPSFMRELIEYKNQYTFKKSMDRILSSGSLLTEEVSKGMYELFGKSPYEIFGSTETGGVAWRQQYKSKSWTIFPEVKVSLDNENHLCINSPFALNNNYVMSDAAKMEANGTFTLMERTDRMVKIAEKCVSLPEMEDKLNKFEYIKQSYVLQLDTGSRSILAALVVLNEKGKEIVISKGKRTFTTKMKQYLMSWFETVTIPRKVRFAERIPTNTQGKILKNDIKSLFETRITDPIILDAESTKDKLKIDLYFLEESSYLKGHFPGYPILPGVIQTHFVFKYLKDFYGIVPEKYSINKLKFTNLILPKQKVNLVINRNSDREFSFSYINSDKISSSGNIRIEK